ncbi:putative interleukin-17 receptor E-like [Cheilinus undulatus]|uniref:putative interleukin-17 receptor E-like n=1 Tax=Cheilinus undulatus TaxID=241271 RepID=UPI001BD3AFE2|nr:putative interleukin-17 receptor E-like [Cheilinus undulatus]XP_041637028.1 putative interleukin-17 receptor E-like [Cheilinus undulatus]
MILFVALLLSYCFFGLNGAAGLERINKCGTRCSQGLRCRTKPDYFFHPSCENPPEGLNSSSIFRNISLSTVMRCEGRQKCSLHLRIKNAVLLSESIHGLSICTSSAGMIGNCQIISFKNHRKTGLQVEVENDCTEVSLSQHVKVTVKTMPSFCGISWTGAYRAPECNNEDMQRHVPECITGRLSYSVNTQRKELTVGVSDMLEDHNYYLRLCRKDFICMGTGAHTLIKKEELDKSITFPYSRPLPCLCIEGWSAVTDAPRVQVCPFRDHVEELWFGINFDPLEETLSWEPTCPVTALVVLCQKREGEVCEDLPHASQNVGRAKVSFTKVDPHPQLCMKFTTGSQSWTRCPFADAGLQAWDFSVTRRQRHDDVKLSSRITANFSVGLCEKSESSTECQITTTRIVHMEKHEAVDLNLAGESCNTCLQVKRLDVRFAATVLHCFEECNEASSVQTVFSTRASGDSAWVIVPVGVGLSAIIIVALALHVLLTVYQKRKQRRNADCASDKQTDPANECAVRIVPSPALIPDCGNTEKANLISD